MSCAAGPSKPPGPHDGEKDYEEIDFEVVYVEGPPPGALLDALAEFLVELWVARRDDVTP